MSTCYDDPLYEEALKAIVARIDGEWDHLDLVKVGVLSDTISDVHKIAKDALLMGGAGTASSSKEWG